MVTFTEVSLVVENISAKEISVFGQYRLRPGGRVDLFKVIPDLTESRVLDGLKSPSGELYAMVKSHKTLNILSMRLSVFDNVRVGVGHIASVNSAEAGKVLGFNGVGLEWIVAEGGGGRAIGADFPLKLEGDLLRLGRAGPDSSGYLSREDWLAFSNMTTGARIWQYYDLELNPGVDFKIGSFSSGLPFNASAIVSGSAVLVDEGGKAVEGGFFRKGIKVVQHSGDTVVLDRAPGKKTRCRVYFLVVLAAGVEIPADYEGAPDYVRKVRSEYFDFADLNSSKSEMVKGGKTFGSKVDFSDGVGILGDLNVGGSVVATDISLKLGAEAGYVLTSSALGKGGWSPNPMVSDGPPVNCYRGQLWVRRSDLELFIYDGEWLSVCSERVSGWSRNLCDYSYLGASGFMTRELVAEKSVLVGLIGSSVPGVEWCAEVHVNGVLASGAVLVVGADGRGSLDGLRVPFNAGDRINFYVNGHNIDKPKIEAVFKRCL